MSSKHLPASVEARGPDAKAAYLAEQQEKERARQKIWTEERRRRRAAARAAGIKVDYHHHAPPPVDQEVRDREQDEYEQFQATVSLEQLAYDNECEYHPEKPALGNVAIRLAYWWGWRVDPTSGRVFDSSGREYWPSMVRHVYGTAGGDGANLALTFALPGQPTKRHSYRATRLAAYCYWGERIFREHLCVMPLDGDPTNLKRNNLKLATRSQVAYAREKRLEGTGKHRTRARARGMPAPLQYPGRAWRRKLDEHTAALVRTALDNGIATPKEIAARLGVSTTTVRNIDTGTTYPVLATGHTPADVGPRWVEPIKAEAKRRRVSSRTVQAERHRARLAWFQAQQAHQGGNHEIATQITALQARLSKYETPQGAVAA